MSGQLNGEYYACALSNIYTFGERTPPNPTPPGCLLAPAYPAACSPALAPLGAGVPCPAAARACLSYRALAPRASTYTGSCLCGLLTVYLCRCMIVLPGSWVLPTAMPPKRPMCDQVSAGLHGKECGRAACSGPGPRAISNLTWWAPHLQAPPSAPRTATPRATWPSSG